VIAVIALQLFLAFSPLIPLTAGFWHTNNPSEFYGRLALMVGLQFTFATLAMVLLMEKEVAVLRASISGLISAFPVTVVKRLKDFEFYDQFRRAVEDARHSVRIAYFAPYPPLDVAYRERKKYYDDIVALMSHRSKISFKRLVRQSPKNDPWVAELISKLRGRPNVDVAVLTQDLPETVEMPLALSVQVVDDDKAWLVATASHETEGDFRDLYIQNADVAKALGDYYDRLWSISVKVLDRGRVTEEGERLLGGGPATSA